MSIPEAPLQSNFEEISVFMPLLEFFAVAACVMALCLFAMAPSSPSVQFAGERVATLVCALLVALVALVFGMRGMRRNLLLRATGKARLTGVKVALQKYEKPFLNQMSRNHETRF